MEEQREVDFTAQFRGGKVELPPPAPPPFIYRDGTPISALIAARKKLDDDTTTTWLLVGLLALSAFVMVGYLVMVLVPMMMSPFGVMWGFAGSSFDDVQAIIAVLVSLAASLIGPVLVVIAANRAYRRQYDMVTADLVHGDLALMLVDESYGRMIQEWREKRYRPVVGEVHLGSTLAGRLVHFAAYYPQYFRMAGGQREFNVTPATPLNCWMDGLLLGCLGCNSLGCLYWLIVPLPLRVLYTYPKSIATRRAALDYFYGKWDLALEDKYRERGRLVRAELN